jgi:hypothetical protein
MPPDNSTPALFCEGARAARPSVKQVVAAAADGARRGALSPTARAAAYAFFGGGYAFSSLDRPLVLGLIPPA